MLLEDSIDYAGLFPPAQHPLESALDEYCAIPEDRAWMVDLFVCASNKLTELDTLVNRSGNGQGMGVAIVGNPIDSADKAAASFDRDIQRMESCVRVEPVAYEVSIKLSQPDAIHRTIKTLARCGINDVVDDVYIEFGWSSYLEEAMHDMAATNPEWGAKARTGGVTADLFPDPAALAHFIHTAVSIEIPFKFTAGLHQPLRYRDAALEVDRFGFLNVLLASACALAEDLSDAEIAEVLQITDKSKFKLEDDAIEALGHRLDLEGLALYQDWCGGFGSCSVDEPVEGLKTLGYWNA